MSITIEGLNKRQRALADIMWSMDGKEQVLGFIHSLQGQHRKDAETVLELMLWAIWDECTETPDACRVIQQVVDRLDD